MNKDEFIEHTAQSVAEISSARFLTGFNRMSKFCESPIEEMMLAALMQVFKYESWLASHDVFFSAGGSVNIPAPFSGIHFYVQSNVDKYRPDFCVTFNNLDNNNQEVVVIECDGHDYHERTKEQARHDKQRDRWMTEKSFRILRFTGSEIYANPIECAWNIERAIVNFMGLEVA